MEKESWLDYRQDQGNEEKKIKWLQQQKEVKKMMNRKRSEFINNCIEESKNGSKELWTAARRVWNWEEDGPPLELRDKRNRVESKLEKVVEIYHDSLEEKVYRIVKNMEPFAESSYRFKS